MPFLSNRASASRLASSGHEEETKDSEGAEGTKGLEGSGREDGSILDNSSIRQAVRISDPLDIPTSGYDEELEYPDVLSSFLDPFRILSNMPTAFSSIARMAKRKTYI
jgi:hypothetical protein